MVFPSFSYETLANSIVPSLKICSIHAACSISNEETMIEPFCDDLAGLLACITK